MRAAAGLIKQGCHRKDELLGSINTFASQHLVFEEKNRIISP